MRDEDLFCLKKVRTVDAAKYLQDGTTAAELRLLIQEHRCPFADVDLTPGSHRRRYRINVGLSLIHI